MTRFLYIADTHLGALPMGYQQQQGYPERLPEILRALCQHFAADGGVDFVLHGGDMVDSATDDHIRAASEVFDLPVPVYLCLGNHDLTVPDAVDRWLALAPRFFVGGAPDFAVATEHCVVHVAPNHWCDRPYYWNGEQRPHFSAAQRARLARAADAKPQVPHLILTHSPVYGLPPEQTGFAEPYHGSDPAFTAGLSAFVAEHPSVTCVLGAHNHMNMRVNHGGVEFATVSALVETPFEFKLFEASSQRLTMSTVSLQPALAFGGPYDVAKAFVQGRATDRSFSVETRACQEPSDR